MKGKKWIVLAFATIAAVPALASGNKDKIQKRGLIEKMEAVPCGASQKGISGLGALWGSAGITKMSTNEKLCPQYLLRTDEMDYEIRPRDLKHATLLPVGQEGEFEIKKNELLLTFPEADDHKTRAYQIVQMNPVSADTDSQSTSSLSSNSDDSHDSGER